MEAKVVKAFTDRITQDVFLPGVSYVGEDARIAELVAGGYLEQPAEKPKKAAPKKAAKKKTE